MSEKRKSGSLSHEERRFIEVNVDKIPVETIALRLKRNPATIQKYINSNKLGLAYNPEDKAVGGQAILTDLRKKPFFKSLTEQLTEEELNLFIEQWIGFVTQFTSEGEVLSSEELELKELIFFEVLKSRTLREEKECLDKKAEVLEALSVYSGRERDTLTKEERGEIRFYNDRLNTIENQAGDLRGRFAHLCDKSDKVRKSLYSSRQQRTKDTERSGMDFAGLLKSYEDYRNRKEAAKSMEIVAKAEEKERERLTSYNEFADNMVDRPILNSESVKK